MYKLSVALVSLGMLSGCTTVGNVIAINDAVSKVSDSKELDTICKISPVAYSGFQLVRSQVETNETIIAVALRVDQAFGILKQICVDRPANIVEALATATKAYTDILNSQEAVVEAKAGVI